MGSAQEPGLIIPYLTQKGHILLEAHTEYLNFSEVAQW